jgi:hypothetical protein
MFPLRGGHVKKLATLMLTLALSTCLSFAQTTGDKTTTEKTQAITIKQKTQETKKPVKKGGTSTTGGQPANVEINPQPLPPRTTPKTSAASKVELNPQPLPPGAKVGFNPQPDPPVNPKVDATSKVTLNPQPLPPKVTPTADKTTHNTKIKAKGKKGSSTTTGSTTPK